MLRFNSLRVPVDVHNMFSYVYTRVSLECVSTPRCVIDLWVCVNKWTRSPFTCVCPLIKAVLSEEVPSCEVFPRGPSGWQHYKWCCFSLRGETQNIHVCSDVCGFQDLNLPLHFYQLLVVFSNPNRGYLTLRGDIEVKRVTTLTNRYKQENSLADFFHWGNILLYYKFLNCIVNHFFHKNSTCK